jgi:methylated-DNA-[protein]-cysteine S-methyltransferase
MNTRHAVIDSPLDELTLVANDDASTGVYFRHHWYRRPDEMFGPRFDIDDDDLLAEAASQLTDYLTGHRADFDLPIALHGDEARHRGWSAAPVRHGVSAIRSGERFTLGLVFHDAA